MSHHETESDAAAPADGRAGISSKDSECEQLRASIRRLQAELAERQAEARPMPSSVMRAYQKLIDRHFAKLARTDSSKEY